MRVHAFPLLATLLIFIGGAGPPAIGGGERLHAAGTHVDAILPPNLQADTLFVPVLEAMSRMSPTFRRQCRRLAAASGLRVHLLSEDRVSSGRPFSARTVMRHEYGGHRSAQVYMPRSGPVVELIAHELEHIIEQIDGVDLEAQAGNGVVWKSGRKTFETRRAIEAGARVALEVDKASPVTRHAEPVFNNIGVHLTFGQQIQHADPVSAPWARMSGDGRHVAFVSELPLLPSDRNGVHDIYVANLATGALTHESGGLGGASADGSSLTPAISRDGRLLVYESLATNLTDAKVPIYGIQIFLRDRQERVTRLLTTNAGGNAANGRSRNPVISADGTTVVFESTATDLGDSDGAPQPYIGIYQIRLDSGSITRLDLSSAGRPGAGHSRTPAVSANGRFVTFTSNANLMSVRLADGADPSDRNGVGNVYLRDTHTNITRRISRSYAGGDPDGLSYHPAISGDGRYIAFVSQASNLIRGDRARVAQIYIHDVVTGRTELVSRAPDGRPANGASARPSLSHDGSRVAFQSLASNLLCQRKSSFAKANLDKCQRDQSDINLLWDVFVYDRSSGRTIRASADSGEWMEDSWAPSLDGAGRVVTFGSMHPINEDDDDHDGDLYVLVLDHQNTRTGALAFR
jgi:Tol biopolymer transport system component